MSADRATPTDAEDLTELLNESYRPAEAFLYDGPRTSLDEVRARLAKGVFLVSRSADGLDGCVYVEGHGERGYLGMLAVSPRRQGAGLGRELVREGEAFLRERGVERLEIEVVNLRRELFAFYDRLGYRVTGRSPFEDPRLRLPCHFVVMEKSLRAQDPASGPPA
jgi:ribosomal protein S18 acetylase RimI-like enzyme